MEKALIRNSEGKEVPSDKSGSVAWKIKLSIEDLTNLRLIAEEMGKNRLIPKPTVTALVHKAIHSYIAAWNESISAPSGSNGTRLGGLSHLPV